MLLSDVFIDEEAEADKLLAALPLLLVAYTIVYLCFVTYRILFYRTSGYELCDGELKCNRGVFIRKKSVLDYKRIHAVNKKQNLFHKLFGIAVLTVDSGSTNTSHQAEIMIIEREAVVDALLNELSILKEGGTRIGTESAPQSTKAPEADVLLSESSPLYSFTSKRKMLYTLINVVATSVFTAILAVLAIITIGACKLVMRLDFLGTWGQYLIFSLLIAIGAMLLFSFFTFIGCIIYSFVGYYDFSITRRGEEIRISYGLLERHTNTFGYDRIKAVKISQGIIQRILGFAAIKLEVIGYTADSDEGNTEIGVLVPFCKYSEVNEILAKVLPDYVPDKKQTGSVSYFPFVSWFSLILGTVTALVLIEALIPMLIFKAPPAVILIITLASVGIAAAILFIKAISAALAYYNNGIAVSEGKITAYFGGFTRTVTVFMSKNLIAAESVTTPLRERLGIRSLVMHLKTNASSNEIKVHIQEAELAERLEELLIT